MAHPQFNANAKSVGTINGKSKNSVTIAHWNGGSSFLAKSDRGREKLTEIENYLRLNEIDVLGVSEVNLDATPAEYDYKIESYSTIKSP